MTSSDAETDVTLNTIIIIIYKVCCAFFSLANFVSHCERLFNITNYYIYIVKLVSTILQMCDGFRVLYV